MAVVRNAVGLLRTFTVVVSTGFPDSHRNYLTLLPCPPRSCLFQQHHTARRLGGCNGLHQQVPSRRTQAQRSLLRECSPSLRSLAASRTVRTAPLARPAPLGQPRPLFPG